MGGFFLTGTVSCQTEAFIVATLVHRHFHPIVLTAHPAAVLQSALLKGAVRTPRNRVASAVRCRPSRDRARACSASCVAH